MKDGRSSQMILDQRSESGHSSQANIIQQGPPVSQGKDKPLPAIKKSTLTRAQQNQLEQKQEQIIENIDKSPIHFSKKQSLIVHEWLPDFYTIKPKRPISDDKAVIQIYLSSRSPLIKLEPAVVTLNAQSPSQLIKVIYETPKEQIHAVKSDEEFCIEHRTMSSEFEFHRLNIQLKCYKLGSKFKELLGVGQDTSFQLGQDSQCDRLLQLKYSISGVNKDGYLKQTSYTSYGTVVKASATPVITDKIGSWKSIAMGVQHTVLVSQTGELYCWGTGQQGQLGMDLNEDIPKVDLELAKTQVPLLDKMEYASIKELGHPTFRNSQNNHRVPDESTITFDPTVQQFFVPRPTLVSSFKLKVVQVAAGAYHTMVLTECNKVYGCGYNNHGQLGLGSDNFFVPTLQQSSLALVNEQTVEVKQIVCGMYYSMVLGYDGSVQSAGLGRFGIHGSGTADRRSFDRVGPSKSPSFALNDKRKIINLAAGEDHAAALDRLGNVYLWGRNTYGQCGLDPDRQSQIGQPTQLQYDTTTTGVKHFAIQVACGGDHTLVLNQDNDILAFGFNNSGQLGLSSTEYDSFHVPKKVHFFIEKVVSWIAAGSNHSAALTVEGYSYTWGDNETGQLGCGDQILPAKAGSNCPIPRIVEPLLGRGVCVLVCSYGQTFFGNAEVGFYTDTQGEIFKLWKKKLRGYEDKLTLMANHSWKAEKRSDKIKQQKIKESGNMLTNDAKKNARPRNANDTRETDSTPLKTPTNGGNGNLGDFIKLSFENMNPVTLDPNPAEQIANANIPSFMNILDQREKRLKKKIVYEQEDYKSDACHVTCFKKVSARNPSIRLNCFVTTFPFRGHAVEQVQASLNESTTGEEAQHFTEADRDQNQVNIHKKMSEMVARQPEDDEIKKSPYVFLMNKAKMESMLRKDPFEQNYGGIEGSYLKVPCGFSMFNRQTEYPFDPMPNVFKMAPGGDQAYEGGDDKH